MSAPLGFLWLQRAALPQVTTHPVEAHIQLWWSVEVMNAQLSQHHRNALEDHSFLWGHPRLLLDPKPKSPFSLTNSSSPQNFYRNHSFRDILPTPLSQTASSETQSAWVFCFSAWNPAMTFFRSYWCRQIPLFPLQSCWVSVFEYIRLLPASGFLYLVDSK